jgi:anthranilate synthase component 1
MIVKSIHEVPAPWALINSLAEDKKYYALLESVEGPERKARYSIITYGERAFTFRGNENPNNVLKRELRGAKYFENPSRFKGGLLGYYSYEAVKFWEKVKINEPEWPYAEFFVAEDLMIYDHLNGKVYISDNFNSKVISQVSEFKAKFEGESKGTSEMIKLIEEAKDLIRDGEIFQVVLSKYYLYSYDGDLIVPYLNLRKVNPSPYMYYINFGNRTIIGSSPETLFRVDGEIVETFPIAGTRPRGKSEEEDLELEKDLLESEKERAEHIMLVDLARNDLGKVCKYGSVKVPEFMYIEKYSHVQHIVSRVIGVLDRNMDSFNVVESLFPAGTVSGAPKPRAMDIITEKEGLSRGPYAGAVGYYSVDGNSEMAITIRSLFATNGVLKIQAGAGIVYDSEPIMEVKEIEHKLKALKKSIGVEE